MNLSFNQITTGELAGKLNQPNLIVIDTRDVNAYNGWRQRDEKRGGHIKGAKSLPVKWGDYIDWIEIVRSKNILPHNSIVLYGYDEGDTEKIARRFLNSGYTGVSVYHDFVNEWSANDDLPMENLARYRQLVSPAWLKQLQETGDAPEYENNRFVVCHAHYRNRNAYDEGHIPGAVELDTNLLE